MIYLYTHLILPTLGTIPYKSYMLVTRSIRNHNEPKCPGLAKHDTWSLNIDWGFPWKGSWSKEVWLSVISILSWRSNNFEGTSYFLFWAFESWCLCKNVWRFWAWTMLSAQCSSVLSSKPHIYKLETSKFHRNYMLWLWIKTKQIHPRTIVI